MNKYEFRVVWKRRGMDRKTKRYATLKAAENRVLFMGPEPWLALKVEPDALQCCPGTAQYECGCGGQTWREHLLGSRQEPAYEGDDGMPAIEYIRIERRALAPWESLPS